jgi:hypothetical protein
MNAALGVRADRFEDFAFLALRVVLALLVLLALRVVLADFADLADLADFAVFSLVELRAVFAPPALLALFALFALREPALFALFFAIRPPSQEGVRARRGPADVRVARQQGLCRSYAVFFAGRCVDRGAALRRRVQPVRPGAR